MVIENTSLWAASGQNIDYYFVVGENMDNLIAGYRHLTAKASLMPEWPYGSVKNIIKSRMKLLE